jgi:hypothetical protein
MTLISGLAVTLVAIAALFFSMPRKGKTAWFVGTELEGYLVVLMIAALGVGLAMISGTFVSPASYD